MIEEVVMQMVLMLVMCLLHYNQVKKNLKFQTECLGNNCMNEVPYHQKKVPCRPFEASNYHQDLDSQIHLCV